MMPAMRDFTAEEITLLRKALVVAMPYDRCYFEMGLQMARVSRRSSSLSDGSTVDGHVQDGRHPQTVYERWQSGQG